MDLASTLRFVVFLADIPTGAQMLSDADAQSVRHAVGVLVTLLIGCGAADCEHFFCATRNLTPAAYADVKEWSIDYWVWSPKWWACRWLVVATKLRLLVDPCGGYTCGIRRWHRKMRLPFWSTHYICPCLSLFASCQRCQFALQTEVVIITNMGYTVPT